MMARHEDPKYKPSFEAYLDKTMGLCVVTTERDGRQNTAQYRTTTEATTWFEQWLTKVKPGPPSKATRWIKEEPK